MKKLFIVLFVLGIVVHTMFAGGGTEQSEKAVVLKLGVVTPTDHPHSISAREFARIVEERTNGQVTVQVSDNGSLGSNPELLDGVQTGVIDLTISTPGVMAEYSALTGILELPYLFVSKEHMMNVTRGPIGKNIADVYAEDTGVQIIGYFGGAQRNMIAESPITSIEDLKGMKMRTWEWSVMLNWWKSLGAIGSVVAFPEVYTALQTGVVDGAENEFTTFTTARWAEVVQNVTLTQHNITVRPLVINAKKLASLPADIQNIILETGLEVANFDVELEGELDQKNMEKLRADYNVVYHNVDKTPFIDASEKIIQDFAKEKGIEALAEDIKQAAQ